VKTGHMLDSFSPAADSTTEGAKRDKLLREHEDMFPRWLLAALQVDGRSGPKAFPQHQRFAK
jgi:hypothetical protein